MTKRHLRAGQAIEWRRPPFKRNRVSRWYYVVIVGLGLLVGAFFLWAGELTAVIVVLAALFFFLSHVNQPPKLDRYRITEAGIGVNDRFYTFEELKHFWIVDTPPLPTLYVDTIKRFRYPLSITVPRDGIGEVREILRQHLPETKRRGELLIDLVARMTGLN